MNLEEIFSPGGLLDRSLPNYEFRPSQLQMAESVQDAIQNQEHLLVEAGTGTGKTLAYLIPAVSSEKRVLISTATKNLQEQLFFNDLPLVRQLIFPRLKAVCLKGRQNYLCLKKYKERAAQLNLPGVISNDVLESLSSWIKMTRTGDRSELEWLSDNDPIWSQLDARSDHCIGQKCSDFSSCFVTRIRQRAFESDVLVVNHALFFANLALESDEIGRILPDFAVMVMDEAHEIEDIAGPHFGRKLSSFQVTDLCHRLRSAFEFQTEVIVGIEDLENQANHFFNAFPGSEGRHSLNHYRDSFGSLLDLRFELHLEFDNFMDTLKSVYRLVESIQLPEDDNDIFLRRLDKTIDILDEIFNLEDPEKVYWFEKLKRGVQILMTPVNLSPIMRQRVFDHLDTVVLTSATLTTENSFEYIRNRLGVDEAEERIVPGEFDYRKQSVLYIPRKRPSKDSTDYEADLLHEIESIINLTQGDAFLLFTSYRQMHIIYEELKSNTEFFLLKQGDMPRSRILEVFKSTKGAVLCATSSFWQGVDVRGPALKAVVIDKLPFQVPTEPLVAARVAQLEQLGENAFLGYTVPSAVITLKQGLGRLIRSRKDYGILAVLDSRIWTRKYGIQFLKSLPNCPVTDNIEDLENFFAKFVSNTSEEVAGSG